MRSREPSATPEVHAAKIILRREMQVRREAAHAADRASGGALSLAAAGHFLAKDRHTGMEVIAGFRPIRTEIDVTPVLEALASAGHRLCLPVVQGAGKPLGFREWRPEARPTKSVEPLEPLEPLESVESGESVESLDPGTAARSGGASSAAGSPMEVGPFGILVPATGAWLVPALLLVPLLAFDAAGWRLGYGGGFYDRTLAALRARAPTLAVGFAYAAQEVPEVPREPFDQRLDAVVTEAGWVDVRTER
jgi:5-formyltetrahydrofolate cyclo-ligase